MAFYILSPYKPTPLLMVQGTPSYLFGSYNDKTGPTFGAVISNSAVTTTGTLVFNILSGNIPAVGSLITVIGTANGGGNFNVTNAPILTVSTTTAGICTVTYTISSTTQGALADGGQVQIPQPEVGDALATGITSSAPVVSPAAGPNSVGKSLSATIKLPASSAAFPSTLTGVTVVLQGANIDLDSEYNTLATVAAAVAAGTTTDWQSGQGDTATGTLAAGSVNLLNFRFYRLQVTAATGAGPIIGKLLQ